MAVAYATEQDFTDELEGVVVDDSDALQRYLERATRDVDRMVGWRALDTVTGLKFGDYLNGSTFAGLTVPQQEAITRATVYQALYRINLDAAREGGSSGSTVSGYPVGARSVTGPDFSVTFATAQEQATSAASTADRPYYFSAQAWAELAAAKLIRTTAWAV